MWSSLSGAGRFVSRAGSGILTDLYGFPKVAFIAFSLQLLVAGATSLYLFCCECSAQAGSCLRLVLCASRCRCR